MVFSSSLFIFLFLPLFLVFYFISGKKLKNPLILVFSILFYAWGAPGFIFIVLGSLIINYYIVNAIYGESRYRRHLMWCSILINIGLLAYFKYANFFIENVNSLLQTIGLSSLNWTRIALPIGISFFTFQSLTYTLDVYRRVHAPLKKLTDYLLYILMFPQLIAGPIVRFHTIADQIENRSVNETYEQRILGFLRFIMGLSKKVLLANTLGAEADRIFSQPESINSATAWIGILAYTFQIYYDFSGYSDMAIGIGRMIGFTFPENFNNPYVSQSITEFWRRWHMTLGAFMKDYLYIPLGGNRVNTKARLYFNLWVVFLISGLWHGASWSFVLWGAYHGLFLILDRLFLIRMLSKIGKPIRVFITFLIIVVGWVFFRIENLKDALSVICHMFSFRFNSHVILSKEFVLAMIFAFIFSFITLLKQGRQLESVFYFKDAFSKPRWWIFIPCLILFILSVSYITSFGFNPFIYFRF